MLYNIADLLCDGMARPLEAGSASFPGIIAALCYVLGREGGQEEEARI